MENLTGFFSTMTMRKEVLFNRSIIAARYFNVFLRAKINIWRWMVIRMTEENLFIDITNINEFDDEVDKFWIVITVFCKL